jgi:hypothetical protein
MPDKISIVFLVILSMIVCIGCSSYDVKIDVDPDSEFDRYETFGWLESSKEITSYNRLDNTQLTEFVQGAVNRIMIEKGYEQLPQGDPDLVLMFYAGVKGPINVDEKGYTYGKWFEQGRAVDQEGVLVIDMIDNERRVLIWRGYGDTIVDDPEEAAGKIESMVWDMLADVPARKQ